MDVDGNRSAAADIIDAVSGSALGKIVLLLFGDVASFAGIALKGTKAIRGYYEERRKERATRGDAKAAVSMLLQGGRANQRHDVPPQAEQQVLIILSAFAEAWGRCRAYDFSPARIELTAIRERFTQILARHWVAAVGAHNPEPAAQLSIISRLVGDPLRTPHYRALWATLTEPEWTPLLLDNDKKLTFEQFFRLAYSSAITGPEGQDILRYLDGMDGMRASIVRQLIIQDMAGWGGRHVFGNIAHHEQLPDLPLCEMYVQPSAVLLKEEKLLESEDYYEEKFVPVLTLVQRLLWQHSFVVVQADMGHGKSLSARCLAWLLAQEYIAAPEPSSELYLPIFIKCAEDLTASLVEDLPQIARRAIRRHARELHLNLAVDDQACSPPEATKPALYILDGLDEVGLCERDRDRFFEHLSDLTGTGRRFLVLSRPQVVPKALLKKMKVPIVEILPLSVFGNDSLAQEWIARWNLLVRYPQEKPFIEIAEVQKRELAELVETPILLFMIAFTWDAHSPKRESRAALYEAFFCTIAYGKHEQDRQAEHRAIREAAEQLLGKLVELSYLRRGDQPHDAMLWLMSRVAWKAHCLSQVGLELCRSDIEDILRHELRMRGDRDAARVICGGLLLALQADPEGEDPSLLFGHKSFREYMVARFWSTILRRMLAQPAPSDEMRAELCRHLLEGRLLQREDRSFDFLMDLINLDARYGEPSGPAGWSDNERRGLCDWANVCFNDESIASSGEKPLFRTDRRSYLREAALAIGCAVNGGRVVARDALTLRTLLAWFWLRGEEPIVRAPGLQHSGANLANIQLSEAVLDEANLDSANFVGARLTDVSLTRATLCKANLHNAILKNTGIRDTNLTDANLVNTELEFINAIGANLTRANLSSANLRFARLQGASLEDAKLSETTLCQSDLEGANLHGVCFTDAKYSSNTQWPDGFDPTSTDAKLVEDEFDDLPF